MITLTDRVMPRTGLPSTGVNDAELLAELEPAGERLLERHLATAKEWFPHEFVPWSRGRDFVEGEEFDPEDGVAPRRRAQRAAARTSSPRTTSRTTTAPSCRTSATTRCGASGTAGGPPRRAATRS